MSPSVVYRSPAIYEILMRGLYGRHYASRYRALADIVPPASAVLDVCSGPGVRYSRFLRDKGVQYTALDLNQRFLARVRRTGAQALHWDVREQRPLPPADYVIR